MPMMWMAAATIGSGLIGANAAQNSADTQAAAANKSLAEQKRQFDIQNAQQAAGRGAGYQSFNTIRSMMPGQYQTYDENGNPTGTATGNDYLTHQFNAQDFQNNIDPGYQFRLQQGMAANQNAANQSGGMLSGNTLQGMQNYAQGAASQEYGNAFNRYQTQRGNIYNTLANIAGLGQTAQGQANQIGQNYANNQTGLITASGNAQAAGQVGVANALSGGLNGAGSSYTLSQMLKPQTPAQPSFSSSGGGGDVPIYVG